MIRKKFSVFLCAVFSLLTYSSTNSLLPPSLGTQACWQNDQKNCVIDGYLCSSSEIRSSQVNLPIHLKCLNTSDSRRKSTSELIRWMQSHEESQLKSFEKLDKVILNGCRTPLDRVEATYGYELLPNCGKILETNIEMFRSDAIMQLHCHQEIVLEVLKFRNNEIPSICADSLANLLALREIYIIENSIRYMDRLAFENLPSLKLIDIEREEYLDIRDGEFFEATVTADLRLIGLRMLSADLLKHLPVSMRIILIADTLFVWKEQDEGEIILLNSKALQKVSIINCALQTFVLNDSYSTIAYLNLSRNEIKNFRYTQNLTKCSLLTLDLSENKLEYFPEAWLRYLQCVETLSLLGNNLKEFSLKQVLLAAPGITLIDLRQNMLETLKGIAQEDPLQMDCDRLEIPADQNPWNCIWLQDFLDTHPRKFRIFHYKKLISKINVNGLECHTYPRNSTIFLLRNHTAREKDKEDKFIPLLVNSSATYALVYGNSFEAKRNQRAEALIIVFLLPLGIATLFVLLYMWIYCQKIFHWSYCCRNMVLRCSALNVDAAQETPTTLQRTAKAFSTNMENYEVSFNILTSECKHKFVSVNQNSKNKQQCKKSHVCKVMNDDVRSIVEV